MAKKLHLVHVKSNVLDKAPSASTISYGEIAVNYNVDSPALYIKDDEDNIVKFISEPYFEKIVGTGVTENDGVTITPISEVIQEDEEVVSAALNDLNDRKADKSDLDDAISGLTEYIDEQLSAATIEIDSELDSGSTNPVENRAIWKVIVDDEEAIAASLNDLNARKADKEYVDEAISGITFDVDDHLDSASTNPLENRVLYQIIAEDERVTAAALNDLNDRKAEKEDLDEAISGLTEYIDEQVSAVAIEVDSELDSASTNPVENRVLYQVITDDEEVVAAALNDLNSRKADKDDVDEAISELTEYIDEQVSAATIEVDSELDSASTNPVENRVLCQIITEDEEVTAAALNDLNERKADKSDLDDAISGLTEYIDEQVSAATIEVDSELDSGSTNPVENRAIWEFLEKDEKAISAAFNDLNTRKANITYVDDLVSELAKADTSFSNALGRFSAQKADRAYVDAMISNVAVTVDSALDSASTNPVENKAIWKVIVDNELIVSSALNDLNDNKADRSELSDFADINDVAITGVTQSGSGNAVTAVTVSNKRLTVSKGDISGGGGGEQAVTGVTISGSGNAVTNATFSDKLLTLTKGNVQETISDLASIRTSASTQPDWNASTGVAAIQNKPAVITGVTMNSGSKTVTNGVVDLGTVITAQTQLSTGATQGSGNVVTSLAVSNHQITLTKDITIPAWATAATKPSYTASEVGALASNATLDNVSDGTTRKLSNYLSGATMNGAAKSVTNGVVDLGTVITAQTQLSTGATQGSGNVVTSLAVSNHQITLTKGITIPAWATASTKPSYTASEVGALASNATLDNVSDGTTRKLSDYATAANLNSHTGSTQVHVPSHSSSDSGKVLSVDSSGNLTWITPSIIYTGSNAPNNNMGNDGDIYLQTS